MNMREKRTTKEKILYASIRLFSDNGYENVSMRQIAKAVGIRAASIYNHYFSKSDILKSIYSFYVQQRQLAFPSMESLLQMAETESSQTLLARMNVSLPPALQNTMDRIITIATQRVCVDKDSEYFVQELFFTFPKSVIISVLNRMVEVGRIKPVNIDAFTDLVTYFSFGAAALKSSGMAICSERWARSMTEAFSLLRPVPPEGEKSVTAKKAKTKPAPRAEREAADDEAQALCQSPASPHPRHFGV